MNVIDRVIANKALAHWAVRKWLGLGPNDADYEDRVQDAMVAIWRVAKGYDPARGSFVTPAGLAVRREITYRQMIAARHGFSRVGDGKLRRPTVGRPVSLDEEMDEWSLHMVLSKDEMPGTDHSGLWAIVAALPPTSRAAVELAYREGMKDSAIGRTLGISRAAAHMARKHGLGLIRKSLAGGCE